MSLQITSPPTETSKKLLKIQGTRDRGNVVTVAIGETEFPVQYPGDQTFSSFITLTRGPNLITVRSEGEAVHLTITLKPLEVRAEAAWNGLDDLGILVNVDRLPEEGNYSFRAWQLISASSYARGTDAQGLLNAALVDSRTRKTQFARLSAGRPFIVFVKSGSLEVRSEAFIETFDLKAGTYTEVSPGVVPERVISGDRNIVTFDSYGRLVVLSDTRAVMRYSLKMAKHLPVKAVATLLGRCRHSIKVTGTPSCASGILATGTWPRKFLATELGCGNGNCPEFSRRSMRLEFQQQYAHQPSLGIVPGVFISEWNGEEFCVDLSWSDIWVLMLSEPEVIDYLQSTEELNELRHGLNKVVPYLFDTVSYDRMVFADDIGVDQSFSIPPRADVALPTNPMSGGRLTPVLENTDQGLRLRTAASAFWMGEERYQLFNKKATRSALDLAVVSFRFQDTVFRNHAGEVYSGVPGDVSGAGVGEDLSAYSVSAVSLNGTTVSSSCLLVVGDELIFNLGKVSEQLPSLAANTTLEDFIEITFTRNLSEYPRKIQLSSGKTELLIDGDSPVLVTDETIDQDLPEEDLEFHPAGEFKLV